MQKSLVVIAASLLLPATAARAETPLSHAAACTRQLAIWQSLFREPSREPPPPCSTRLDWFATASNDDEDATGDGRRMARAAWPAAAYVQAPVPAQTGTSPRPTAFEYSHAYSVRRKIHFYASFATIPLFVTQYILGDKLYDGTSGGSTKSAHSGVAVGIETLFAVNSVTGVWNLWESRKDPNAGKKRFIHGFLMLGADVGFVATGMLAPDDEDGGDNRSTHRNVAITSMAVATASYLIMLIGR